MIFITYRRFICVTELQKSKRCEDFEVRFCCPNNAATGVNNEPTTMPPINLPLPKSINDDNLRK